MSEAENSGAMSRPLQSIQILRAIAALGVVALHVGNEAATRLGASDPLPNLLAGAAGVDLFFVISGFIMVYASEALFGRADGSRIFFARRVLRIVPLYWLATAAAIACFVVLKYSGAAALLSWESVAASLFFVPYQRADGTMLPVHILGWTLNYEMFFYVVFAFALMLGRGAAVAAVTALFAALVLVGRLHALPQPLAFWSDPIILEFCFGMLVALAYRRAWRLPRAVALALIATGFAALAASGLTSGLPRIVQWGLPAAAIVAGTALIAAPRAPGLAGRVFAFLGDASYSIYLVHWLAILVLSAAASYLRLDLAHAPWLYIAAHAAFALGASVAVYLLFERPVTRALQRRLAARRSAVPVAVFPPAGLANEQQA